MHGERQRLGVGLLAGGRLGDHAGTNAASADGKGADGTVSKLVAHTLEVRIEATFGLDVGMAHKIADLRLLAAESAFFAHGILRIYRKTDVTKLSGLAVGVMAQREYHDLARRVYRGRRKKKQGDFFSSPFFLSLTADCEKNHEGGSRRPYVAGAYAVSDPEGEGSWRTASRNRWSPPVGSAASPAQSTECSFLD